MNLIKRELEDKISDLIGRNKVITIFGTRRIGKTVLTQSIKRKSGQEVLTLNAEDFDVQEILKNRSAAHYKRNLGKATLLIVRETQIHPKNGHDLNDINQNKTKFNQ